MVGDSVDAVSLPLVLWLMEDNHHLMEGTDVPFVKNSYMEQRVQLLVHSYIE
jgi:hypothetical protein